MQCMPRSPCLAAPFHLCLSSHHTNFCACWPRPSHQVYSQAPAGLGAIVAYWICLYIATGFQESKLHVE